MKNKNRWFRYSVQIFFFVLIGMFAVNHVLGERGSAPFPFLPDLSLHAICPFGGVESIISFISAGRLVPKLHTSTMVMSVIVVVMTLVLGSIFCSFICPLGTIQEWFGKLGRKIFKKNYNKFIPRKVHNVLKYFRYVSLVLTIILTYNAMKLVFLEVDPYYAMYHFFTDEVTVGSMIVLGVTLLGSLFVERPWCKYACPYGAALGLISKISIFKIRRDKSTCNSCSLCDSECPMKIEISKRNTIGDSLCNRCMICTDDGVCNKNSLVYSIRKPNARESAENEGGLS